ncbi:glutathione S-transferase [Mycena latifolia]|nr:glutathione S-transferase [Mycena latifolia]
MVLKLYGGTPARADGGIVAMVLAEKQIPFEFAVVDLTKGEHKTAEFLAKYPFGQDDDGFILYESCAIHRYLAEKYAGQGTPLRPTTLMKRALFEQAASIELADFDSPSSTRCSRKAYLALRDAGCLRNRNSGGNTITPDEFTLADVFHLTYAHFLTRIS